MLYTFTRFNYITANNWITSLVILLLRYVDKQVKVGFLSCSILFSSSICTVMMNWLLLNQQRVLITSYSSTTPPPRLVSPSMDVLYLDIVSYDCWLVSPSMNVLYLNIASSPTPSYRLRHFFYFVLLLHSFFFVEVI